MIDEKKYGEGLVCINSHMPPHIIMDYTLYVCTMFNTILSVEHGRAKELEMVETKTRAKLRANVTSFLFVWLVSS